MARKTTKAAAAQTVQAQPSPEPTNDLSDLGEANRPYHYRIRPPVAQFHMAKTALEFSRATDSLIDICDSTGKVIRTMDYRIGGGEQPAKTTTGEPKARTRKGPTKQDKAIELLRRENGATSKELSAAMGWSMGEWHVNRISRVTGLHLEVLGDKHWRLVEP